MAWDDVQASGGVIDFSEWNAMVTSIKGHWCSSNYAGHSGNADIHFPSSNLTNWLDNVYQASGSSSGFTPHVYPDAGPISVDGSNRIYFSGQGNTTIKSGSNTIIISSSAGSATLDGPMAGNIGSDYTYGLSGLAFISTQTISGGIIKSNFISANNLYVNDKIYHKKDVDTYMDFGANNIVMYGGSYDLLNITTSKVTVNDGTEDIDFVVKGTTDAALLYVNAGSERVGIGKAAPLYLLHVDGVAYATVLSGTKIQSTSYISANTGIIADWVSANTSNLGSGGDLDGLSDTDLSSPASGEVLTYDGSNWVNELPSMTYSLANIRLSAQQNINMAKFSCPAGKSIHIWQAYACNSSQTSVADLCVEVLSGTTSLYKTSSSELQQGNPLDVHQGGDTEIRFMYSGANASGIEYGTCMVQLSVY